MLRGIPVLHLSRRIVTVNYTIGQGANPVTDQSLLQHNATGLIALSDTDLINPVGCICRNVG